MRSLRGPSCAFGRSDDNVAAANNITSAEQRAAVPARSKLTAKKKLIVPGVRVAVEAAFTSIVLPGYGPAWDAQASNRITLAPPLTRELFRQRIVHIATN